ncbi:MAG: nicotinate (nicotinamide) nucleotide adenylyltransferase [Bacilli bacterium]|nr:nicotinate (nicotinamide) nucleotide adenylyltransferase [Bacilli bacterium]
MRIGIFGGCFNPPHQMHKDIALNLIKNNYLDKVIYVPTGDNYKKQDLILFKDRYNMVKLMISDNKDLLISDIGNNENYQYTYQVLDYYKSIYKEGDIYFICGSDNLKELDSWMEYEYILNNFKILVIRRNNDNIYNIINKYYKWKDNIITANVELNYISSTQIRDYLKESGTINITSNMIDENVLEYIIKNQLYANKLY